MLRWLDSRMSLRCKRAGVPEEVRECTHSLIVTYTPIWQALLNADGQLALLAFVLNQLLNLHFSMIITMITMGVM